MTPHRPAQLWLWGSVGTPGLNLALRLTALDCVGDRNPINTLRSTKTGSELWKQGQVAMTETNVLCLPSACLLCPVLTASFSHCAPPPFAFLFQAGYLNSQCKTVPQVRPVRNTKLWRGNMGAPSDLLFWERLYKTIDLAIMWSWWWTAADKSEVRNARGRWVACFTWRDPEVLFNSCNNTNRSNLWGLTMGKNLCYPYDVILLLHHLYEVDIVILT